MASPICFLFFIGITITVTQSVISGSPYEWQVERSSVNPLSYTEEDNYYRDRANEIPVSAFFRKRDECPPKEKFSLCESKCVLTCDNYWKPRKCPRHCIWGCVCKSGLVRGPDKKCIIQSECPGKPHAEAQRDNWCGEYEIWDFRYAHCPRNCSNYDDVLLCRKIFVSGCVCDYANGYVRGPTGNCLTIEKCPYTPEQYLNYESRNKPEIYSNSYVTLNPPPYTDDDYHIPESVTENPQFQRIPPLPKRKPSNFFPFEWMSESEQSEDCYNSCQEGCISNKNFFTCFTKCIPVCIEKDRLEKEQDGKCIDKDKCPTKMSKENLEENE